MKINVSMCLPTGENITSCVLFYAFGVKSVRSLRVYLFGLSTHAQVSTRAVLMPDGSIELEAPEELWRKFLGLRILHNEMLREHNLKTLFEGIALDYVKQKTKED